MGSPIVAREVDSDGSACPPTHDGEGRDLVVASIERPPECESHAGHLRGQGGIQNQSESRVKPRKAGRDENRRPCSLVMWASRSSGKIILR